MDRKRDELDRRLLEQAAAGDERGLAELFERYGAACCRRAQRVLWDAALAEDAVQEAFLDLWRTAAQFDPERSAVFTWLCVLVHRRSVDIARREARRRSNDRSLPLAPHGSATAEEELLLLLDGRRLNRALGEIREPQRRLVALAFYGGLTQPQLARVFDVPLGTIKSRMSAALAQLALVLES